MNKLMQLLFMTLFIIMILTIISILTKKNHPINIIVLILLMITTTCLYFSLWKMTCLFATLIFLIMISGLFVIYGYFTSLISNEAKSQNKDSSIKMTMLVTSYSTTMYMYMTNNMQIYTQFSYTLLETFSINDIFLLKFNNIMYMYIYPMNNFTLMTMLFMLLAFILVIKINNSSMSMTLRKIN